MDQVAHRRRDGLLRPSLPKPFHAGGGNDPSARVFGLTLHGRANRSIIDDPRSMGFDFTQLFTAKPAQAVLVAPIEEGAQAVYLGMVRGDNKLAANFVADVVVLAKLQKRVNAGHGQARLR